jgi:hypothetical protein
LEGYLPLHVDDSRGGGTTGFCDWVVDALEKDQVINGEWVPGFKIGAVNRNPKESTFLGATLREERTHTGEVRGMWISQRDYVLKCVHEIQLEKQRAKQRDATVTTEEEGEFRKVLGCVLWAVRTCPEAAYEASALASAIKDLRVDDLLRLNKLVRGMRNERYSKGLFIPTLPGSERLKIVAIADAGLGGVGEEGTRTQGGKVIGLQPSSLAPGEAGPFAPNTIRSTGIRRVVHAPFDAETITCVDTVDEALSLNLLLDEFENGPVRSLWERKVEAVEGWVSDPVVSVPVEVHVDSEATCTRTQATKIDPNMTKRRKLDIADLRECRDLGLIRPLIHISGEWNPTNALTKRLSWNEKTMLRLLEICQTGWYEPMFGSTRKGRKWV